MMGQCQSISNIHQKLTMTRILGKDEELENSIARMQELLSTLGFNVVPASWLNPVPNVWSVHIRDGDCPQLFTNGKGRSREAALASALGEFFERLASNYFFADFYLGSEIAQRSFVHYPDEAWLSPNDERLLNDEPIRAVYDQDDLLSSVQLYEINSASPDRGICALPFTRLDNQEQVWIPVNLLENIYASNGMSAGNNPEEARVQALSEIFERGIKFRILRESICLPEVPDEIIALYPQVATAINAIREAGFTLLIRDASLGGRYPVISVTLLNPEDGSCFASFGAHPLFEVALERTVTELLQGRALEDMKGFSLPSIDHEEVASVENLETHFIDSSGLIHWRYFNDQPDYEFKHWNFEGTSSDQYKQLSQLLHDDGQHIYLRDYEHMGFYTCRILVPGFSDIYPPEDLWYANNNAAIDIHDCLWALPTPDRTQLERLQTWLDKTQVDEFAPMHELAGLRPGGDSYWNHFRVGELRVWVALAMGQLDDALDALAWIEEIDSLPAQRKQLMQCIRHLIELEQADGYEQVLAALHGAETLKTARAVISGRQQFAGIPAPREDAFHQSLIAAYDKAWQQRHLSA
jgi:ribosomal protein S12 methylthiotransferase accessory factor